MSESTSFRHSTKTNKSPELETTEEVKNICFTNLLILGFDLQTEESNNKLKFHRDMFDDVNKTGCEVILHFLFQRLNADLAKEEFKICYPVLDRKQEQMFRKTCSTWIVNIAKENKEFNFPSALSSILMKKGGRKFYPLLFSLSRYVLFEVTKSELGPSSAAHLLCTTKLTKSTESEASQKLFQALLDEHMNSFVTNQLYIARHVKEERLQNLVSQYYHLKKQIKAVSTNLEASLDELNIPKPSQLKIVQGENCDEWNAILETTKLREQRLNENWSCIENTLHLKEQLWNVCDLVIIQQKQRTTLKAKGLRDALAMGDSKNLDLVEPLRLSHVSSLLVDSLSNILNRFENVEIPTVKLFSDDLVTLHVNQLKNIEKFRNSLNNEVLPDLQQDYFNLWKQSNCETYKEQVKIWQSESTNQLCVPSPPMSLTRSFETGSCRGRTIRRLSKTSCDSRATDKQSILSKKTGKSISDDNSSTSNSSKTKSVKNKTDICPSNVGSRISGSESSNLSVNKFNVDEKSISSHSESYHSDLESHDLQQFDAESEFNLSLLESPLSRSVFHVVEPPRAYSPQSKSTPIPPRLLQLLGNMKLEDPCGFTIDDVGIGTDTGLDEMDETFYDLSFTDDELTRPTFLPMKLAKSNSEHEADSSRSPTLDSSPRSLPMIVSSNLRDFLSWEQVLQSGVVPQQNVLLRETKSAVDLHAFEASAPSPALESPVPCRLSPTIEKSPVREVSEFSITLSRTDLSLEDIFAEDENCLLPSSPAT